MYARGILQKFRLVGIGDDNLNAAHFERQGKPTPFQFKFPPLTLNETDHCYAIVLRDFLSESWEWQEGDHTGEEGRLLRRRRRRRRRRKPREEEDEDEKGDQRGRRRRGRIRTGRRRREEDEDTEEISLNDHLTSLYRTCGPSCGQLVAMPCGEHDYMVCELQEDGSKPKQLASWHDKTESYQGCQVLGQQLLLFAPGGNQDAFYSHMDLIEWQTGTVIKQIPLEFKPHFIESEWPRGILEGSTQTFFTCFNSDPTGASMTFAFATPGV